MKTTIYIDKNLVPRYSPNGWPSIDDLCEEFQTSEAYFAEVKKHQEAIEKAKADSVPFDEESEKQFAMWRHRHYKNQAIKPDAFIECEIGEVEVVQICMKGSCAQMDGCYADGMAGEFCAARKVARLKPAESDSGVILKEQLAGTAVHPDGLKGQILEAFSAKWMAAGGANHDYIMNTLHKTLSEILG